MHALKTINFEQKQMMPLINVEYKSYVHYHNYKYTHNKNYPKVRGHWDYIGKYRGAALGIFNSKYSIPKDIPVVPHSTLKHYYHFIKKELTN